MKKHKKYRLKHLIHKRNKSIKYQILISLIPIIAIILILIGNSYAVFTYLKRSENTNIIKVGTLNIEVTDNGAISLINSYPISDSDGLNLAGYQFKITNTGTLPTRYSVRLEKTSGEIANNNIRYSINNGEVYTLTDNGIITIDKEELNTGSSNSYILKLWIKEDASNNVLGQEFHAQLVVESLDAGVYTDNSGAAYPKLDDNMIPVIYDKKSKEWIKVDLTQKWYDYNNRMWANVVTVKSISTDNTTLKNLYASTKNCTGTNNYCNINNYMQADAGTIIPMSDIAAMFVWIPRYNYTLYSASETTKININFENIFATDYSKALGTCENNLIKTIGCNYTHPAFTIGRTELTGIWVGKFETGTNMLNSTDEEKIANVFIKPNLYSLTNQQVANQFKTAANLANLYSLASDTHMMKNSEWGAVTYLTNSKYGRYDSDNCISAGCEVWINNVYESNNSITGCSSTISKDSSSVTANLSNYCNTSSSTDYTNGVNASSTGNIYGIYDMSGGSYEYTMSTYSGITNNITWANSKYYNIYTSLDPLTACNDENCYGFALSETSGWNSDTNNFINSNNYWLIRGGSYSDASNSGIFSYISTNGSANNKISFRVTVTK